MVSVVAAGASICFAALPVPLTLLFVSFLATSCVAVLAPSSLYHLMLPSLGLFRYSTLSFLPIVFLHVDCSSSLRNFVGFIFNIDFRQVGKTSLLVPCNLGMENSVLTTSTGVPYCSVLVFCCDKNISARHCQISMQILLIDKFLASHCTAQFRG